jgi:transposase-like protein
MDRRRRLRDEDRLCVLAEAEQPGARTSEMARRHDISRGLLRYWRRQLRQGRLAVRGASEPMFLPVRVSGPVSSGPLAPAAVADARIEIALPDGICVRGGLT